MEQKYGKFLPDFIYSNGCDKEVSKEIKNVKNKNEHIEEIMGVNGKPDIIDIIEKKRLQWYGHVKSENTKANCGIDTAREKEKGTSKKNVDGRSTSSHGN